MERRDDASDSRRELKMIVETGLTSRRSDDGDDLGSGRSKTGEDTDLNTERSDWREGGKERSSQFVDRGLRASRR